MRIIEELVQGMLRRAELNSVVFSRWSAVEEFTAALMQPVPPDPLRLQQLTDAMAEYCVELQTDLKYRSAPWLTKGNFANELRGLYEISCLPTFS